jgi:hypothetical protein
MNQVQVAELLKTDVRAVQLFTQENPPLPSKDSLGVEFEEADVLDWWAAKEVKRKETEAFMWAQLETVGGGPRRVVPKVNALGQGYMEIIY